MTLDELTAALPEDEIIKIGTVGGTNFFFCGPVKVFNRLSYHIDKRIKWKLEDAVDTAERAIERNRQSRLLPPEIIALTEKIKQYELKQARERLRAFQKIGDREVRERFTADVNADEAGPTVIYIDGDEDGTYWTVAEAEKYKEPLSFGYKKIVAEAKG